MTPEQSKGIIVYLRSLTPQTQMGMRGDFGGRRGDGGRMRGDGGFIAARAAATAAWRHGRWRRGRGRERRLARGSVPPAQHCPCHVVTLRALRAARRLWRWPTSMAPGVDGRASIVTEAGIEADAPPLPQCAGRQCPPVRLECTGLYADLDQQAAGARREAYAPAVPLWSDGAEKHRWVLPRRPGGPSTPATRTSGSSRWGRKFLEAVQRGRQADRDAPVAEGPLRTAGSTPPTPGMPTSRRPCMTGGGDIPFGSGTYHIPTQDECEKCHRGRTEHILGFEEVELGLPGATGITLPKLVTPRACLTTPPATAADHRRRRHGRRRAGAGLAARQLRHHLPQRQLQRHRLPVGAALPPGPHPARWALVGRLRSPADRRGRGGERPQLEGQVRIVPGNPADSLLYYLISHRGPGMQMPPIATRMMDEANVALVRRWIAAMPGLPKQDAGPPDAEPDAGMDAAPDVVEMPDTAPAHGGHARTPGHPTPSPTRPSTPGSMRPTTSPRTPASPTPRLSVPGRLTPAPVGPSPWG